MQIVIDIDENTPLTLEALWQAFQKSPKPLPEHHGRLIDADALIQTTILDPCHAPYIVKLDIDEADTIIPATKGENNADSN